MPENVQSQQSKAKIIFKLESCKIEKKRHFFSISAARTSNMLLFCSGELMLSSHASLRKQNGITISHSHIRKFKVWLLLATLYNTGEQTECDRVMKQPALTPLCLYSARWRSACLCESVGEKRVVGELWVGDCVETSTTPPQKKKKDCIFFFSPPLDYLQTQGVVKKGGRRW